MAPLNYTALQAAVRTNRFDATQDLGTWVKLAYEQVWNAAEWSFKKVTPTAISLPTSGLPTMPADFGRMGEVFDDLGAVLEALEEREFDLRYQPSQAAGITGRPEAFKVVNRQIVLGPTPGKVYAGQIAYTRRLCTMLAGGVTEQVGNFNAVTDLPFWSPTEGEHHYLIALRAMMVGRAFESDLSGQLISDEYQQALAAMMDEFAVDEAGTRSFGADGL